MSLVLLVSVVVMSAMVTRGNSVVSCLFGRLVRTNLIHRGVVNNLENRTLTSSSLVLGSHSSSASITITK